MRIKINVEIYSVDVILTTTFEEFKKDYKDAKEDTPFITIDCGGYVFVHVRDEWDNMHNHRFIQCLSHELNHAAMCILKGCDIIFDYDNQEGLCYLQDFMIAKAMKAINKYLEKNRG